jgi:S1-C subfamily serine protease
MERVILRHLNGSRSNEVEEFSTRQFPEIIVGRDPSATVRYDPERDDLVGRQHAKFVVNSGARGDFRIVDLGSRNGTYVNGQRIFSETRIAPGDIVQFGAGGPQIQFDVEPRPAGASPPTRLAAETPATSAIGMAATPKAYTAPSSRVRAASPKPGIGQETVERLIARTNTSTRRGVIIGGAALGAAGIIGGGLLYRRKPQPVRTGLSVSEIFRSHSPAVVFIQAAWKLIDVETGRQVYHLHLPSLDGHARLPVFISRQGVIEPVLIDNDNQGKNRSIGSAHSASGFVTHPNGFILTNRHVAATWRSPYYWRPAERFLIAPGLLYDQDHRKWVDLGESELPRDWVPTSAKGVVMHGTPDNPEQVLRLLEKRSANRALEGRHDFLDVTFPDTAVQFPARLARISNNHDVALIKIDITEAPHVLEMDDRAKIKPGDPVVVLGFPAVSGNRVASIQSRDNLKPEAEIVPVPGLTVSTGNIGRVMGDQATRASAGDLIVNPLGDYYQLTVNSTGAGNSGGPVFDANGKVIGIFSAIVRRDVTISYAVPIKYGTELTRVDKVAG